MFLAQTASLISTSRQRGVPPMNRIIETAPAGEESNHGEEDPEMAFVLASKLLTSMTLPMVLNAALQLQVFEIIAKAGPGAHLSAAQIVSRMAGVTNPDAPSVLDRMLRLLAHNDVLNCYLVGENLGSQVPYYALAPVGKFFVTDHDGGSLAPLMALYQDKVYVDSWLQLKNAVLEGGEPFERAHGVDVYEYTRKNTSFNGIFNNAMTGQTTIVMKEFLKKYRGLAKVKKLVDVGGGLGVNLRMIVSKYPSIQGINFDLPHVIDQAPHHPRDMFKSVPKGDAIFLQGILREWDDRQCSKLLKNCHKALPKTGKVIVVEQVYPLMADEATSFMSKIQRDVMMLAQNPGGKERTQSQLFALAFDSGFESISIHSFACNFVLMEFQKEKTQILR